MKKIPGKTLFLITLITLIGLALLSFSYYFAFFVPKQKAEQEYLVNQTNCQKDGNKLYNSRINEDKLFNYYEPEFKFNKTLNTCLIKLSYVNFVGTYEVNEIIDVYKNKVIDRYSIALVNDKWKDRVGTQAEWDLKIKELFNE